MSDFYDAIFRWPHPGASDVIVTGSFDSWSRSIHLPRKGDHFEGTVKVPYNTKVVYKYIVDGNWTTTGDQPTERDPQGFENNIYFVPRKPTPPTMDTPPPAVVTETQKVEEQAQPAEQNGGGIVGTVADAVRHAGQTAVEMVEAIAPGTTALAPETPAVEEPAVEPTLGPLEAAKETAVGMVEAISPDTTSQAPEPKPEVSKEPAKEEPLTPAEGITAEAILPHTEVQPVGSIVPVPIVTLIPGGTTTGTDPANGDVAASKPLDTEIIEGSATLGAGEAGAPAAVEPEVAPSTHVPAGESVGLDKTEADKNADEGPAALINGTEAATNGTDKPAPEANGTHDVTSTPPASPPVNGNGTSPSPTNPKKGMRWPSLSSRHSRASMSHSSVTEFGEGHEEKGVANAAGKETHASRVAGSPRKKRNSIFGKIKDIFH